MAGTVREPALSSAHLLVVTVSDEIEHDTNSKKKLHTLKENACSMAVGARGVPGVHVTLVRFCTERPKSAETAAEPAESREDYSWPLLTPDMLHAADGIVVGEVDGCVRRGSVKISSSLRLLLATSGTLLGKVGAAFSDNSLGDTSPVAQRWLAFFRDQRMVVSEPHMTDYTTVLDELPAATKTATLAAAKSVGAVHTTPATRDRRSAVAKVHSPVATRDPAASQDSAAMRLQGRLAALMARAVARRASQDSLLSQTAKDETVGDLDVLSVWKLASALSASHHAVRHERGRLQRENESREELVRQLESILGSL